MFSVSVEAGFSAVHRVRLSDGTLEPPHGHDWRVRAWFAASQLDDRGMVVDFCAARLALESVVAQFHHRDLNAQEVFSGLNPTAEVVARVVFDRLRGAAFDTLRRVEVTEAPGCVAAYESPASHPGPL